MTNNNYSFSTIVLIIIFISLPANLIAYFTSKGNNTEALEGSIILIVILVGMVIYHSHKGSHETKELIRGNAQEDAILNFLQQREKQTHQLRLEIEHEKLMPKFYESKRLIFFESLLNSENSILEFIKKHNLNWEINVTKNVLSKQKTRYQRLLNIKFIKYGNVGLKKELSDKFDVDISIIDDEINALEMNIQNDISLEIQNQECQNVLEFGCTNIDKLDFSKDIKCIKNAEYYQDYKIETPLNIEELESKYKSLDKDAFEFYNSRVLKNSIYPSYVSKEFEIKYMPESKIMVVDYTLPNIEDIPNIKQINKQLNEVLFKEKELQERYENLLYQITLRTIYELFYNDQIDAIESVVFNGCLNYIDKADGISKDSCIMSIQASKDEFMKMNLEYVDAKTCFRKFKGISCTNLASITPVRPIINIDKNDRRFIDAYDVIESLDSSTNLALMDWQDFENLVRDVFEKEFASNGGEVKITQSSKDGGVDAIAYDPDVIRGGKIVIQAKRYTNVVGISSVRDLYGTIMNEGAIKGILVTTSHYGNDSRDFVKDKPITLLDGNNLLYLLDKHGYKARIDIKEAKMLKE